MYQYSSNPQNILIVIVTRLVQHVVNVIHNCEESQMQAKTHVIDGKSTIKIVSF